MTDDIKLPPLPAACDWSISHRRALAVIALFALPLYLIFLGTGDSTAMMELFNLLPVREAYRDGHWLLPTLGGYPRMVKPPLPVWIPAGLAVLFHTDSLWVVRLPSVILGVLTCWATYAIGCVTSRDRRLGLFAALALAGMLVFVRQSRLASYDIYATAFTTLGFLGLLMAAECRRLWWLSAALGGAALGLSVLSKGPVPPMYVLIPYGLWLLRYHLRNPRAWLAILIALVVSIAVFSPWLFFVAARYHAQYGGSAWAIWWRQFARYAAARGPQYKQTDWYYLAMLGWVFPWTPALIGGLALPFLPTRSDPPPTDSERRSRWMFWIVLVLGLVLLTIPHQKKQRYALQQFPFAALLAAVVWQEFARLKRNLLLEPAARVLLAAQSIIFAGLGLGILAAIPIVIASHHAPVYQDSHWTLMQAVALLKPALAVLGPIGWGAIAVVLIVLGVQIWRWEFRRRFDLAFIAYALAGWIFTIGCYAGYMRGRGYQVSRYRQATEQMVSLSHGHKIYTLTTDEPWLGVLYYANRIMPGISIERLAQMAGQNNRAIFLLTFDGKPERTQLHQIAGLAHRHWRILDRVNDGHAIQTLFELLPGQPAAAATAAAQH